MNSQVPSVVLEEPKKAIRPRSSSIALWRPDIVLPRPVIALSTEPRVTLGEPTLRPEAVRAALAATRSLLRSLEGPQSAHYAETGSSRASGREAASERARICAVMDSYRAEAALDRRLRDTFRQLTALMEERGLR